VLPEWPPVQLLRKVVKNQYPNLDQWPNLAGEVERLNQFHGTTGVELALACIADHRTVYRGTRVWIDYLDYIDRVLCGPQKG
jgi:hypothetical protein